MNHRLRRLLTGLGCAVFATGCLDTKNNGITITTTGAVTLQLVNTTSTSIQILDELDPTINETAIPYGASSSCLDVAANTTGLVAIPANTTTPNAVSTGALQVGLTYLVTMMSGVQGSLQYNVFEQVFTPAAGQAGLRVINAAPSTAGSSVDAYVTAPGASLGTPTAPSILFPHGSGYFNVPAGTSDVVLTNGGFKTVLVDLGNLTFTAGSLNTIILAEPPVNGFGVRAFVADVGC